MSQLTPKMQQQINKAVADIEPEQCPACGNKTFFAAQTLKKVPALLSPDGQPGLAISQIGWACSNCHWIWNPDGTIPVPEPKDVTVH